MPRLYTAVRRPVRRVNPLVLPAELKVEYPPAPPEPEAEPDPSPTPSIDMTLAELKELADAAGLPSYGTKADIVERLTS